MFNVIWATLLEKFISLLKNVQIENFFFFKIRIKFSIQKSNKIFHEFWATLLEKFISLSKNVQNT